jgi:hypothetical protein
MMTAINDDALAVLIGHHTPASAPRHEIGYEILDDVASINKVPGHPYQ